MAGWASHNMANEILSFYYRGTPISIGGSLWLRFLVSPSSRSGGGTETNFAGYARYQLPRDGTVFTSAPSNGALTNGIVISLATATGPSNGNLIAFDIVDTASGAFNKIYNGGPITPQKVVVVGLPPKFPIGALLMTF